MSSWMTCNAVFFLPTHKNKFLILFLGPCGWMMHALQLLGPQMQQLNIAQVSQPVSCLRPACLMASHRTWIVARQSSSSFFEDTKYFSNGHQGCYQLSQNMAPVRSLLWVTILAWAIWHIIPAHLARKSEDALALATHPSLPIVVFFSKTKPSRFSAALSFLPVWCKARLRMAWSHGCLAPRRINTTFAVLCSDFFDGF